MTTCATCGAEKVAGDARCGSWGAFLELAAEEARAAEDDRASSRVEQAAAWRSEERA